jgi:indole-3-glycerol phosphate synthase
MASVDDALARDLEQAAQEMGLSILIESHNQAELERALRLQSPLIGVNNRDLNTFHTDLATTETLAKMVPEDRILISESGLFTHADLTRMASCGARTFLIGESLMRQPHVADATRTLLQGDAQ